jgi:UPF0176 protein
VTPTAPPPEIQVAALYRFAAMGELAPLRERLLETCRRHAIRGTLLIAPEGINGTIAGAPDAIAATIGHLRELPDCAGLEVKYSAAATMPFHRMKVRIKREIVTMGQAGIDPVADAGTYVSPHDWNALIDDPDTIVIDTRNDYEVAIGSFAGAVDPGTATFRDFPAWFDRERTRLLGEGRTPRVAMYCTGGIRCEKASAYLKREGVAEVYHLKGGILSYLEAVAPEASRWQGECFVFDQRVAVGPALAPGTHALCFACRRPVSPADMASPLYEEGASCPACHDARSDDRRASYRERHRQEQHAARRGEAHVGASMPGAAPRDADER